MTEPAGRGASSTGERAPAGRQAAVPPGGQAATPPGQPGGGPGGQRDAEAQASQHLLFEIAPREDIGAPMRRYAPTHWRAVALLAPAALLVAAVLVAPLLTTVAESFAAGAGGLRNYGAVLRDPAIRHAIVNSLQLLAFALLVCLAGLALAWPGRWPRRRPGLAAGLLAAPVAVSALVAGAAFRLLFDPQPGRGTAATIAQGLGAGPAFLGPGWIRLVLGLAFAWQWLGLAVVVFRGGLTRVPLGLLRVARSFGAGRLRRAWAVTLPALLPAGALVLIIVLVAAARVFELVLAAVPGSIQGQVDVVGLHLWRFGPQLGTGESSALAVLLFLLVAVLALAGLWGLRREWPAGSGPAAAAEPAPAPAPVPAPAARRWLRRGLGVLIAVGWAAPLLTLLLTSLHTPRAAAATGWWAGGWGWGSYQAAFSNGQLLPTLGGTALRALFAATVLVVLAAPAAYALAWGSLPQPAVRILVPVAAVLAVLPPQVIAGPLGYLLEHLRLFGAAIPLLLVHVAFGLPIAILLLRGAFAAVPRELVSSRKLDPVPGSALFAVLTRCWTALLAVAVLEAIQVWNDVLVGLLFGGTEAGSVTLILFEQTRQFATSAGPLAADAVLITLVPLALVLVTGRWLMRGLAGGAQP